jgi:hypothetical protein
MVTEVVKDEAGNKKYPGHDEGDAVSQRLEPLTRIKKEQILKK